MLKEGKIGSWGYMVTVVLFLVGDAMLFIPAFLTSDAKQDAWISALIGWVEGALIVALYIMLSKYYPKLTIIQYAEKIVGTWVGRLIALLFISFFYIDTSLMLMEVGDFITTQIMVETPIEYVLGGFAILIVLGARWGMESCVRTAELLFPWFVALLLVFVVFISPKIDFLNVQPILEEGIKRVLAGNIKELGYILETVILIMLYPYVNKTKGAAKAFFVGILIANFILTLIVSLSILVLGPDLTVLYAYPSYALAQKISIGDFVERIEAIIMIMWFTTLYVKITVCYYATVLGMGQLFKLKDYRPLTLPLGILMVYLGMVFVPSRTYFDEFVGETWMPYASTFGLWLPLLLLIVATIRKKIG